MEKFYLEDLQKTNNQHQTIKNMSIFFNTRYSNIYSLLKRKGYIIKKEIINLENYEKEIIEDYKNNISLNDICKKYKCGSNKISLFLKERNFIIKKAKDYSKYAGKINESYFKEIDSSNKAYILGFLYADGNIHSNRNMIQICIHKKDVEILEFIKKEICKDLDIYIDRKDYRRISISNKQMKEDLIKLGCFPNKTHILSFPNENQVSKEFIFDFIRGYFDGDGCISKNVINFTGKKEFLSEIHNTFNITTSLKFNIRFPKRNNDIGSSYYCGENIFIIYKLIYNNSFSLKRKYDKFVNYLIKTKRINE